MRYLAVDPGGKRTGLAVGDARTRIASPLTVIEAADEARRVEAICKAAAEQEVDAVVIGLPLNMDGSEGAGAKAARALAEAVRARAGLTVHLFDERLSSAAAEEQLQGRDLTHGGKRARRDALAAAAILRGFLEREHERDR